MSHPADVFNIEVELDHVYRIMDEGILVHNADYLPDEAVIRALSGMKLKWGEFVENGCEIVSRKIHNKIGVS